MTSSRRATATPPVCEVIDNRLGRAVKRTRTNVHTVGQIRNGVRPRYRNDGTFPHDLDELRAALFFEQRRYHHFGEGPDGRNLDYVQALVGAIRRVSGGTVAGPGDPWP